MVTLKKQPSSFVSFFVAENVSILRLLSFCYLWLMTWGRRHHYIIKVFPTNKCALHAL